MKRLLALRAVLVTGKGGVGKTTVAGSVARFVAGQGKRVLCTEIASDASAVSALGTALGVREITEEPVEVAPNLRLAVLAPALGHQRFLRDALPMRLLADAAMRTGAIRRFLSAAPTFPEMGVLYRLLDLVRAKRRDGSDEHEVIVVDLPATGHALALAQVPRSLLRVIPTGPIAAAIREGLELLTDPTKTGAVVVTLPETLPVSEAIELVHGLEQHAIPVAEVVVNRVPHDPFDEGERAIVGRWLEAYPTMLGARMIERIARAESSLERLSSAVRAAVAVLPELSAEGPELLEEVASRMATEVSA